MPRTEDSTIKQYVIGVFIILTATTVLAATGWNFSKVSEIPEKYILKIELKELIHENKEDHLRIEAKLDRIIQTLLRHSMSEHFHPEEEE